MLFLLKRHARAALVGLAVLVAIALLLRHVLDSGFGLEMTLGGFGLGLAVCAVLLVIDGVIHGALTLLLDEGYLRYFHELADVFEGQSGSAILAGALLAGVGEELFFRGVAESWWALGILAGVFGVAHHIRWSLWPITLWSIWEGLLFVIALLVTGNLFAVMVAHFLHDALGFGIFRIARAID